MATYQKPTEDLTEFNSSVFKTANESTLTLSEATSLFLARVGTASSEATSTTFTNDIYVNGVRAGVGNYVTNTNTCFGNGALIATTSTGLNNCGFGKDALAVISTGSANCCFGVNTLKASNTGQKNTCVGHVAGQAITGASNDNVFLGNDAGTFVNGVSSSNTFVGSQSGRSTLGTATGITALGFQSRCNFSNSTVIGVGVVATAINQITLGRSTETVECVGTVSSISLKTARNLSINGKVFGIGAGGANTDSLFCGLTTGGGNGSNNSIYGSGSYANSGDGSSAKNTIIGALTMTSTATSYNDVTVVGYNCQNTGLTAGTADRITLLGSTTSAATSDSTAIGYGATSTLANQIMLGRSTETVYCPGTVSLVCSGDVKINGSSGTVIKANGSTTEQNLVISNNASLPTVAATTGVRNIQIGNNIGGVTTGVNNTCLGQTSGPYITTGNDNTCIGYNALYDNALSVGGGGTTGNTCVGAGATITVITDYSTCLGWNAKCGAAGSTAIGYNAVAASANQIMLGTSTEFVECAGTDTTNGCLKLNGGLKLQTSYAAVPSSTMLGHRIALSAIAINPITTGTAVSIGSLALTVGVWSLNYTFELSSGGGNCIATIQSFYFSNASGGAYATRINNTGTNRLHFSMGYGSGDNPAYSGGGTYYASAAISLYPTLLITYSGIGALTGTGYASAVRIG